MKKLSLLILLMASVTVRAQTLHLILVSDYDNKDFGQVTLNDEDMVNKMFSKIGTRIGYQFKVNYVNKSKGKGFTKDAVLEELNKPTLPGDIVVFYYSGFGTYPKKKDLYPTLQLNTPITLDTIATVLQKKGLKLGLVMADCRNEFTDLFPEAGTRSTIVQDDKSKEITKKIFLEPSCRVVKIASARKGSPAYSLKRNSTFSYALTESYEDALYAEGSELERISLDNFIKNIEKTTLSFIPQFKGLQNGSIKCRIR
jgi:hypothetical protein